MPLTHTHIELLGFKDYEDGCYIEWDWINKNHSGDQYWEAARYGIFDPLQWSLWTCEEFSDAELQELIDALPSYWLTWHMDEHTVIDGVNPQNLIFIRGEETTEGIYDWIRYFINWIDGSLWSYEYCADGYNGPAEIGCNPPPVHWCALPPGWYRHNVTDDIVF